MAGLVDECCGAGLLSAVWDGLGGYGEGLGLVKVVFRLGLGRVLGLHLSVLGLHLSVLGLHRRVLGLHRRVLGLHRRVLRLHRRVLRLHLGSVLGLHSLCRVLRLHLSGLGL